MSRNTYSTPAVMAAKKKWHINDLQLHQQMGWTLWVSLSFGFGQIIFQTGRDLRGPPVQPPAQGSINSEFKPSCSGWSLAGSWKQPRVEAPSSLGSEFLFMITTIVKTCFLTSCLSFPWFDLWWLSLVFTSIKRLYLLHNSHVGTGDCCCIPLKPSLLQAQQA